MSQFYDLQNKINELTPNFEVEEVLLIDSYNRVLQQDIFSDMDMPPFDKSAVDGYACRMEDLENKLDLIGVIPAGIVFPEKIKKNQCVKIMTGAALPDGADGVFMVEDAELLDETTVKCIKPTTKRNVCYQGEDYKIGTVLIEKGTIINASHIAVMAGAGYEKVVVSKKPKIGLFTTGSELVEPNEKPSKGKIRNSNSSQLLVQLTQLGFSAKYYGIIKDDFKSIQSIFKKIIDENDIIMITGGASVGDFDFIPEILKKEKFQVLWDRTGLKPGNPMTFSIKDNKYSFGLSGNPVSSLIQFELIVKPTLYKILGASYRPLKIKTIMGTDIKRKKSSRIGIQPVIVDQHGVVNSLPFNGSAHINALTKANALLEMTNGVYELKKGDSVYVRPI